MNGRIKLAIINPPIIKQIVATSDGHCKLERPIIACPDVQPPAYLVPKPTRKPPATVRSNPFTLNNVCQLNKSEGIKPEKSLTPYAERSFTSFGLISMGCGSLKKETAINPPASIPATKKRFQASFFQSYLKKEMFEGKQAAQIWRNDAETPNLLFPIISKRGTVSPIKGPATYHGHGLLSHPIKFIMQN